MVVANLEAGAGALACAHYAAVIAGIVAGTKETAVATTEMVGIGATGNAGGGAAAAEWAHSCAYTQEDRCGKGL